MEMATEENDALVSTVYSRVLDKVLAKDPISDDENFVYQVELLSQEVNSGASFEQYFRWAGKTELDQILGHLRRLALPDVYAIVQEALSVAFPDGVPDDGGKYEECTDWSESQDARLSELFEKFENYNGVIINKLGRFIQENAVS